MKILTSSVNAAGLLALLVAAGCASPGGTSQTEKAAPVPATMPAQAPSPPKVELAGSGAGPFIQSSSDAGTVVFFREKKFAGSAVSFKVREGEEELGKLSSGAYFVAKLPPGAHEFTVHSEAKDVLNLELEAGQTYYVQGSISMGILVGRPNLAPSDVSTFDGMKTKLKDSGEAKAN